MMNLIWTGMMLICVLCSLACHHGAELAAAVIQGAQSGITLAISIAGSLCLWSGIGKLMEQIGLTEKLSQLLMPVIGRIFPSARTNQTFRQYLSANICANFLGLGNAATPMGIQAARCLAEDKVVASNELCRLIVLNTASIQLIPANVAALRSSLGCKTPFDILPAVWVTSLCAAALGLACAWLLGKVWHRE